MITREYVLAAYIAMLVITAAFVWTKLGGHRGYRLVCSIVAGIFWPIPVIMAAWLFVEGVMFSLINWFEGNGKN